VTPTRSSPPGGSSAGAAGGLEFRPATEADWPLIWPFWHQIVAAGDTYCYDPAMDVEAGRRLWLATPPDQAWLVAAVPLADPDPSAGLAVLGSYRLGPNKAGPGAHICSASYMVGEAARGRGVGRAMVLHSLHQARAAGYRGIQFNAVAASNEPAVRLYRELGFAVVGTVPGGFAHPRLGYVDLLIMFREL
jgi:ribosomal protein S18 acetylase RimI-like enzyme